MSSDSEHESDEGYLYIWILAKSMVKYGRRTVPYSCPMSTKTSEMNDSARDVFKKSKIIGIGSLELFLKQF